MLKGLVAHAVVAGFQFTKWIFLKFVEELSLFPRVRFVKIKFFLKAWWEIPVFRTLTKESLKKGSKRTLHLSDVKNGLCFAKNSKVVASKKHLNLFRRFRPKKAEHHSFGLFAYSENSNASLNFSSLLGFLEIFFMVYSEFTSVLGPFACLLYHKLVASAVFLPPNRRRFFCAQTSFF